MFRLIALVIGFLLGGIQTAILYGKMKGIDIRQHGSGNAGATNTLRVLGKKAAAIVFLGDVLKAMAAVIIARLIFKDDYFIAGLYAGIGAILGHSYPPFFQFKGGKGIAVTVGTIYAIDFKVGIIASIVFLLVVAITKIVSLSSMCLTLSVPILIYIFHMHSSYTLEAVILGAVITGITFYRHQANIKRLLNGTESKLGSKK